MKTIRMPLWLLIPVLLASCTTLEHAVGLPISGTVVDEATGEPLEGASVFTYVEISVFFQGRRCEHVAAAVTDEQGRFRTPAWSGVDLTRNPEEYYEVYKRGYVFSRDSFEPDWKIRLRPDRAKPEERIKALSTVARDIRCFGSPDKLVAQTLDAIAQEQEDLGAGSSVETAKDLAYTREVAKTERERIANTAEQDEPAEPRNSRPR